MVKVLVLFRANFPQQLQMQLVNSRRPREHDSEVAEHETMRDVEYPLDMMLRGMSSGAGFDTPRVLGQLRIGHS